jgi:[acyl-carrier-protein] S-malonyltransferase
MLFPGQASQAVGMAHDVSRRPGPAADFLTQVDEILGYELTKIMFEGPLTQLTETHHAQPAILAHSVAIQLALQELGVRPTVVAGHSLGEYSAAVAAGALSPADALRLVRRRGELMFAAGQDNPGTMAAIMGLTASQVITICENITTEVGVVCLANQNSANQMVISGEIEAVTAAGEALKAAGAKRVIPLTVSGAFHSPLLDTAATSFRAELADVTVDRPTVPLVANYSARPQTEASDLREGLARQLTAPVLWHDSLEFIMGRGEKAARPRVVLEVGPGRILTNLAKRTYSDVVFQPVGSCADLDKVLDILQQHLT